MTQSLGKQIQINGSACMKLKQSITNSELEEATKEALIGDLRSIEKKAFEELSLKRGN